MKRERRGLGLERIGKEREGLRGERRGNEERKKRRRRFVNCGIVLQFIDVFVFLARVLELRR